MAETARDILARLPGKDCGQCGFKTCAGLAELVALHPDELKRCIHLGHPSGTPIPILPFPPPQPSPGGRGSERALREFYVDADIIWKDMLGRDYDFVLEPFPEDPGPREIIVPLNPLNVERLAVKKGDVLYGRPVMTGCPVTHVGVVVEEPDYLNGVIVWCIVGPLAARERGRGREIGHYNIIAYEGLVRHAREELQIGRRYFFLPRMCMLQSRHSGLVNALAKREDGLRARVEGIWIA